MNYAQFISHYISGNAQFIAQYSDGVVAGDSVLITDIDTGNVDSTTSTVINASSSTPTFECYLRPGAHAFTGGWRHFSFAVENVEGKDPTFKIDLLTRNSSHDASWYPVYTTDYVNWVQADSRTTPGDNFVHFSFPGTLPSGRVYIHSSPTGTYQNSVDYAAYLLSNYPTIAAPVASADSSGIYTVSIPINDDIGRAVGGNNQYGIKLSFPGPTTDGGRKRKLLMLAGIHAAGENHSWQSFTAGINWILESSSQEAVDFRANWDVYLYFLVNVNGVKGGASRADFSGSFDPNRQWAVNGVSDDVTELMAVIPSDTGGSVDAYLGYHGDVSVYNNFGFGCHPNDVNSGTRSVEMQALIDHGTIIFAEAPLLQGPNAPTDVKWIKDNLAAKVSANPEIATRYITLPSWYVDLGEKWMRTLQAVDADGLFLASDLVAANCTQTDTSSSGSISLGGVTLTGANCDQTDTSSVNAISQLHILVPASSTQGDNSGTGVITLSNGNLVAANSTQSDISGTGSISGLPSEASSISSNVFIIWNNIANENSAITHTLGSTASGFPLSNMLNDTKEKVWRSTAGTTQNIQLTWASNRIVNSFALAFTNLVSGSSVRLVLYDATVGGNVLYDSGSITVDYNYLAPVGFNSIGVESFAFGGGTHFSRLFEQQDNVRRAVITLVSTSNPDGYIEVSRLVIGQAWQPEYNPDFGLTWDFDETTERVRTDAGNVLLNRGTQNRIISFNLSHLSVYDKRILTEILKRNGSHEPIFISILPSDSGELYQSGNLYGRFDKGNIRYSDYSRFYSGIKIEEI